MTRRLVTVHYLLYFFQKTLVWLPILQPHLMYLTSIKFVKLCTKLIIRHLSLANKQTWHHPKEATSGSLQLQIWQCTMPTLSQQLRSFSTESRAENCSLVKTRLPAFTPINRSRFHVQEEEENQTQSWQKISLPCSFFLQLVLSLLSLSVVAFSHHHPHRLSSHHHPHLK